jgi:hypothetical protein
MCREKSDKDALLDVEGLRRRVQEMEVSSWSEDDSGEEFAKQIEPAFDEPSDDEMEDTSTKVKPEQKLLKDARAVFDAAVAEDPTVIPKPKPRVVENKLKSPESCKRKRDVADDLAELTTSRANYVINLDMSFDVSAAPKYLQSQKRHYHVDGRDASTIKNLFRTLWLEYHEWLIHERYSLDRVRRVKGLEIVLLIKEGADVKNTHCWTIKGDFNGREQCNAWKEFFEAAETRGRGEALDQLRMIE